MGDRYWSVDLVGLSEQGANAVVRFAEHAEAGVHGTTVDPTAWLTLHLDRDTVEGLVRALVATEHAGGTVGRSVLEVLEDWLAASGSK